VKLCNYKN